MAAHRYWKIFCYSVGGHPAFAWNVAELSLSNSVGGSNLIGSGTITSSSDYDAGHNASKAVDGNAGTFWSANGFNYYDWLKYDFGSGNAYDLVEIKMTDRNDGNIGYNLTWGEVFYSDDNSTYTSAGYIAGAVTTSNGQTTTYYLNPTNTTAYRYWKLWGTITGDGNLGFSELEFHSSVGGSALSISSYTASPDDGVDHIASAFDNNVSTCYGAAGGLPRFVRVDFGSAVNIAEVQTKSRNDGYYYQNIRQGYLEGSNDDSTYVKFAYIANTQSTSNAQLKTYRVVPITNLTPPSPGGSRRRQMYMA